MLVKMLVVRQSGRTRGERWSLLQWVVERPALACLAGASKLAGAAARPPSVDLLGIHCHAQAVECVQVRQSVALDQRFQWCSR